MATPQDNNPSSSRVQSASPPEVGVDLLAESRRRRIHRVPPQLRGTQQLYDPEGLSLGPYHHGQPQCRRMEELKDQVVDLFVAGSTADETAEYKTFFKKQISDNIVEIRNHYEEVEYTDEKLSEIIFRDACFLAYHITLTAEKKKKRTEETIGVRLGFGMWGDVFIRRDINLLENQIPFWIIRRLLGSPSAEKAEKLICKFLGITCVGNEYRFKKLPWTDEPLHLLEARRIIIFTLKSDSPSATNCNFLGGTLFPWFMKFFTGCNGENIETWYRSKTFAFRSATYLKAKGIHCKPNYDCLNNVKFASYPYYGILQLPISFLSNTTKVSFSNIIAYEMFLGKEEDLVATSYVNFMKSLIEKAEDVKELREREILFVTLGNDEEVVKVFNEIDTYGLDYYGIFKDVKEQIDEHCNSKAKTWWAELAHKYFRSPWTAVALFAATLLLCLTFLQTFFTIRPTKGK